MQGSGQIGPRLDAKNTPIGQRMKSLCKGFTIIIQAIAYGFEASQRELSHLTLLPFLYFSDSSTYNSNHETNRTQSP